MKWCCNNVHFFIFTHFWCAHLLKNHENRPIILALCLMPLLTCYAWNYVGITGASLVLFQVQYFGWSKFVHYLTPCDSVLYRIESIRIPHMCNILKYSYMTLHNMLHCHWWMFRLAINSHCCYSSSPRVHSINFALKTRSQQIPSKMLFGLHSCITSILYSILCPPPTQHEYLWYYLASPTTHQVFYLHCGNFLGT